MSRSRMKSFNGILIAMWSRIRILGYGVNVNIERMRWNLLVQDVTENYVGCMTSRDWGVIPQECRLLMMQAWFWVVFWIHNSLYWLENLSLTFLMGFWLHRGEGKRKCDLEGVWNLKGSAGIIIYNNGKRISTNYLAKRDHGVLLGDDGLVRLQLRCCMVLTCHVAFLPFHYWANLSGPLLLSKLL